MNAVGFTYLTGETLVHRCDARVKVLALLVFSIVVVAVRSWPGLAACVIVALALGAAARIPFGLIMRMLTPVYVLAAASVLFNVMANPGPDGLVTGLFFGVRMIVLVGASYIVCLTTTASQLLEAFRWFIAPLRAVRVPVDDIAVTLALSIRFIPVIQQEFARIRSAQVARGAQATGSIRRTFQVWGSAFASLFVGLFRHADSLASAMDARCYGAAPVRTRLPK